jgi:hypothetical protein
MPGRLRILPICIALGAILLTGCQRGVSGTYVAKFTNGVDWLQLVKTPDNHLSGQLVELTLQADGRIDQKNTTVAGAFDGGTVILSSAGIFGMQAGTLSGNLDGNKLTLTGQQLTPVVLNRSNFDEYQSEVKALNAKAQSILVLKSRNPAYAAAKTAALTNSDVEILSTDDSSGTITVRDKKTGKTTTLKFDPYKKTMVVIDENGKEATVRVNINGEIELQSSAGTTKFGPTKQ